MKSYTCRLLPAAALAFLGTPWNATASITGPYSADANTVHLFHLDEASGGVTANAVPGKNNAFTWNLSSGTGASNTTMLGTVGYAGFGNCANFATTATLAIGYDGNGNSTFNGDTTGDAVALSTLSVDGTSPFTLEALVNPNDITGNRQIICTDSSAATRGLQFRMTTGGTTGHRLEFNVVGIAGTQKFAEIPVTGASAIATGSWYHVAFVYDGSNCQFFWTKLNPTLTAANQLGANQSLSLTGAGVITGPLVIGNENRGAGAEAAKAKIDEVRISNIPRMASEFIFKFADTDGDSMDDGWEINYFGNLSHNGSADADTDGGPDGLTDLQEYQNNTNPNDSDTDDDTLKDGVEVSGASNAYNGAPTNPLLADTDGDQVSDSEENGSLNTAFGSAPTDPNFGDSDSDGTGDYEELAYRSNPNDSNSIPAPRLFPLINNSLRNGSFELLGAAPGVANAAKASHWDTDADGDVTYWTLWPISTANNDSGTETAGSATNGTKRGYLQAGNAVYNLTSSIAQQGDVYSCSWKHVATAGTLSVNLVYSNGGTITAIDASLATTTAAGGVGKLVYKIPAGSPAIGKQIGIGVRSGASWIGVDEFAMSIAERDSDGDGLGDFWEDLYFGNNDGNPEPAELSLQNGNGDPDNDGSNNTAELNQGTKPNDNDSDDDTLLDGAEVAGTSNAYDHTATNPLDADSDHDGLTDAQENGSLNTAFGNAPTNPHEADSDGDGFPDQAEIFYSTNPNNTDSKPLLLSLIGNEIRNGSFELLGAAPGTVNAAKASHWDTDPDGDVPYWTVWPVESTAETDSGTEGGAATNGTKHGYLQNGNAVYNLTDHIAQQGDILSFHFDHVGGGLTIRGGLVYNDGGTITRLAAAEVESTATGNGRGMVYVIPAGSPAIGKAIGVGFKSNSSWPAIDSVTLTVPAADADHDGLADDWEDQYFGNDDGIATPAEIALYNASGNPDGDAFTNLQEQAAGSNPSNGASIPGDVDGDGLGDEWELTYFHSLIALPNEDPDGDHDTNMVEFTHENDPMNKLSFYSATEDSIPDSWKAFYGIPSQTGASDLDGGTGDGMTNEIEFLYGTSPIDKDSDDDGLNDGAEATAFSNPLLADTDGDGLLDGAEVNTHHSDPTLADTDGDSFGDKYEVDHGSLPNNASSVPTQPSGFNLVENFEGAGMTVGQTFSGVNGWTAGIASTATVVSNPLGSDKAGQLFRATGVGHSALRKALTASGLQIMEGNTGTVFLQIYCDDIATNHSFGLSDSAAPGGFGDYEAQFATVNGDLSVNKAGTNTDTTFNNPIQQWMNVWIVTNNATDTVKVFVESPDGQSGKVEITAAGAPFGFRNGTAANALVNLFFFENAAENIQVLIDNIYVDPKAENLANPMNAGGDSDSDGLPDAWETTYFGGLGQTAAGDFDRDGTDNLTEYRLGLTPNSGSSRFAATRASGGTIQWPSVTGVTFTIERSTNLNSWTTLQAAFPGTAGTATYTDPAPPAGKAFYKVTLNN